MLTNYFINQEDSALLIVDIQEKLIPAMDNAEQMIKQASILVTGALELELPIVVTEQYPKGLGHTSPIIKSIIPSTTPIFEKMVFSAYTNEVALHLKNLNKKKIILIGIESHVCVFQTARDLLLNGYQVFLPFDCVTSRLPQVKDNALQLLASMGCTLTNSETILFDLLKEAGSPEFKAISKLIK